MNIRTKITVALLALAVVFAGAGSASAATASSTAATKAARLTAQVTKAIANADREITRRIDALNMLSTRIGSIKKLTDADKASIDQTVQTQISDLTALKAKIDADTDITTLRADVKSIAGSYRIFALVIPQGHLLAAVDSVNVTADSLTALATKLQTRIAADQTAGRDVTAMNAALTNLSAKVADARSQAAAAEAEFSVLKPDNGDKAGMAANTSALKDARAKIKIALGDLKTARNDAQTIIVALRAANGKNNATSSASTTNQ